jgi:hypothetical protein
MNPVLHVSSFIVVRPWRMLPHMPLKHLVAVRHDAVATDTDIWPPLLPSAGVQVEARIQPTGGTEQEWNREMSLPAGRG